MTYLKKTFKNVRVEEVDRNHIVVRATFNLPEWLSRINVPIHSNLHLIKCAVQARLGQVLIDNLRFEYPIYSVLTTDEKMAEITAPAQDVSVIVTKYLAGRWLDDFESFNLYFAAGGIPISHHVDVVVGAAVSFDTLEKVKSNLFAGRHVTHLILSKESIESRISDNLSAAKDPKSLEREILTRDALMIFPEYDEPLMAPDYRTDPIFSDHHYVGDTPSLQYINDIYVVTADEKVVETVKAF